MPYCINELSWLSTSEDRKDKDRHEVMSLILNREGACVLGPEMGEEE